MRQYQVRSTDCHFLEAAEVYLWDHLAEKGPSKLCAPEGTNTWMEGKRDRTTGCSFPSDGSQRLLPPENPPRSVVWPGLGTSELLRL